MEIEPMTVTLVCRKCHEPVATMPVQAAEWLAREDQLPRYCIECVCDMLAENDLTERG